MLGAVSAGEMVIASGEFGLVPEPLVALTVALVVAAASGMPVIAPDQVLRVAQLGRPLAP